MTYHISQIDNKSSTSAAIVNPNSNPNGRDSCIILPSIPYKPTHQIEVSFIKNAATVSYDEANTNSALNIYTMKDNWFFWDNGLSALNGVGEASPNQDSNFYNGAGTYLTLTIGLSGDITFAKSA